MPIDLAAVTKPPSRGTVRSWSVAALRGTLLIWLPVNKTIWPNRFSAIKSTAFAPRIVHSDRSMFVELPPRCRCPQDDAPRFLRGSLVDFLCNLGANATEPRLAVLSLIRGGDEAGSGWPCTFGEDHAGIVWAHVSARHTHRIIKPFMRQMNNVLPGVHEKLSNKSTAIPSWKFGKTLVISP